jgi:hypothetical protein
MRTSNCAPSPRSSSTSGTQSSDWHSGKHAGSSDARGVQLSLLTPGVAWVVTPREHPSEQVQARAAAPAVFGAVASHRTEVLRAPVADRDEHVGTDQHQDGALHESTSSSWAVAGEPARPAVGGLHQPPLHGDVVTPDVSQRLGQPLLGDLPTRAAFEVEQLDSYGGSSWRGRGGCALLVHCATRRPVAGGANRSRGAPRPRGPAWSAGGAAEAEPVAEGVDDHELDQAVVLPLRTLSPGTPRPVSRLYRLAAWLRLRFTQLRTTQMSSRQEKRDGLAASAGRPPTTSRITAGQTLVWSPFQQSRGSKPFSLPASRLLGTDFSRARVSGRAGRGVLRGVLLCR